MMRASDGGPTRVFTLDRKQYAKLHKTLRHSEIIDLLMREEKEVLVTPPQPVPVPDPPATTEQVLNPPQAAVALATLMKLYKLNHVERLTEYTNGQLHKMSIGMPVDMFNKAQNVIRILYFAAHVTNNLPLPQVLPTKEGQLPITYGLHYRRERFTEETKQQHVAKGGSPDSQWCYRDASGEIDPSLEQVHWSHSIFAKQVMPNGYTRATIDSGFDRLMWTSLGGRYTDVFQYLNLKGKPDPWLGLPPPDNPSAKGLYANKEFAINANAYPEIFPLVLDSGAIRVDTVDVVQYGVPEIVEMWVEKGGSSTDRFMYVLPSGTLDTSFHMMLKSLQPYQRSVSNDVLADVNSFTEDDVLVKAGFVNAVKMIDDSS